jgi:hypothetical protein
VNHPLDGGMTAKSPVNRGAGIGVCEPPVRVRIETYRRGIDYFFFSAIVDSGNTLRCIERPGFLNPGIGIIDDL